MKSNYKPWAIVTIITGITLCGFYINSYGKCTLSPSLCKRRCETVREAVKKHCNPPANYAMKKYFCPQKKKILEEDCSVTKQNTWEDAASNQPCVKAITASQSLSSNNVITYIKNNIFTTDKTKLLECNNHKTFLKTFNKIFKDDNNYFVNKPVVPGPAKCQEVLYNLIACNNTGKQIAKSGLCTNYNPTLRHYLFNNLNDIYACKSTIINPATSKNKFEDLYNNAVREAKYTTTQVTQQNKIKKEWNKLPAENKPINTSAKIDNVGRKYKSVINSLPSEDWQNLVKHQAQIAHIKFIGNNQHKLKEAYEYKSLPNWVKGSSLLYDQRPGYKNNHKKDSLSYCKALYPNIESASVNDLDFYNYSSNKFDVCLFLIDENINRLIHSETKNIVNDLDFKLVQKKEEIRNEFLKKVTAWDEEIRYIVGIALKEPKTSSYFPEKEYKGCTPYYRKVSPQFWFDNKCTQTFCNRLCTSNKFYKNSMDRLSAYKIIKQKLGAKTVTTGCEKICAKYMTGITVVRPLISHLVTTKKVTDSGGKTSEENVISSWVNQGNANWLSRKRAGQYFLCFNEIGSLWSGTPRFLFSLLPERYYSICEVL